MKTIRAKQAGFTVLETVIVIAVLAILGAVTYAVMSRQPNKTDNTAKTTTTTQPANAKAETANIKSDVTAVDVDKSINTGTIDEALR